MSLANTDLQGIGRLVHASSATTVDLYGTQSVEDMKSSYRRVMQRGD
jgi:hypothetical protein